MTTSNFDQVVMVFLRDRLVERHLHRTGLGNLIEKPDLSDGLENHLRAAALVGCKRDACNWLGMKLFAVVDPEVPEAGWIRSSREWTKRALDVRAFKAAALNAFGWPIVDSARRLDAGTLADGPTKVMLGGVDEPAIERVRREPGETIWVQDGQALRCVEGNARMHALALGLTRGTVTDEEAGAWTMWVGR